MTHTPGKWAVSPFRAQVICDKFGRDGDFLPVAQMLWPTEERSEAETYANARLIAAAPDLLEAGEALAKVADDKLATVHETVEAIRVMRAAIAKARGETA